MTRLLIMGAPGAGKGTQAARLAIELSVPAISTGDMFRDQVKLASRLGRQVQDIIAAGDYVPDALTNEIVDERLTQDDASTGFILDGYPRTADQVAHLDLLLQTQGTKLDAVIHLEIDMKQLLSRLLKRADTQGRVDDSPQTIQHRVETYNSTTGPLLEKYKSRGRMISVDGLAPMEEVTEEILRALHQRCMLTACVRA